MNVRVHRAVSDLDGQTGMAIVEAIVKGERDAVKLAELRHPNCKRARKSLPSNAAVIGGKITCLA